MLFYSTYIFTTTREMGGATCQIYKRLSNLLTEKLNLPYGEIMGWTRCKLSLALVRSAITCICGAHSWMHSPVFDASVDVQIAEAHFIYLFLIDDDMIF